MCSLLLLAAPGSAFFPPRVDVAHNPELSGELGKILGSHWFERKDTILTGEDGLGKDELDAIYQAQLDHGIRNIPLLSLLLVRESLRVLDQNDFKRAEFFCQYAKKFAPDFPSAHFAMGRIYYSRSKTLLTLVLREYLKGVHAILRNFRVLFFKSLNTIYLISGALLLTFVAFTLFVALKYLSLYVYDVKREFDLAPPKFLVSFVKVFAFVVPVLFHLNLLWSLLYWAILMWGYLARRERQMIAVFLLLLVYIPWSLNEATDFLEKPDSMVLMTLHEANEANWIDGTEKRLNKWSQQNPEDADVLFTLGLLHKREGNYKEAERYYKQTLEKDPNWAECISNLGNVYLGTRGLEEAVSQYERAISLSPRKASFYFNLHRAFSTDSILSSEKVGQALETANKLDPGLVAFYTQIYSDNLNRSVIDNTIGAGRLWKRALRSFEGRYVLPEGFVKPWMKKIPARYGSIYPVFFLVLMLLFWFICSKRDFSKRCPLCGTPSVKFFRRKIEGDMVCFGCNRLFVKKESIDPKMKEKKMRQARHFEKRRAIIRGVLTLIVPGGGHLWKDQPIKGTLFVFVSFLVGLMFFYWNGIVQDPISLGDSIGFWNRLVFVVFFVLYYLGVLRSALRIE